MGTTSKAQLEATARYDKANTKTYAIKLNYNSDADLINRLEEAREIEGVQGYIKRVIRAAISGDFWPEETRIEQPPRIRRDAEARHVIHGEYNLAELAQCHWLVGTLLKEIDRAGADGGKITLTREACESNGITLPMRRLMDFLMSYEIASGGGDTTRRWLFPRCSLEDDRLEVVYDVAYVRLLKNRGE